MDPKQQFLYEEVPQLLENLTADAQPLWGQMTAQHMVEHVSGIFYIGLGKITMPLATPPEELESYRAWLMSEKPFRPSITAPGISPKLRPLRFADLDEAKGKLLQGIEGLKHKAATDPDRLTTHPVFGELTPAQWEHFHDKHTRHHLMQFGLIPMSDYVRGKLEG